METKQKTLAECKNEVAKNLGYKDWSTLVVSVRIHPQLETVIDMLMNNFASEENRKKDDLILNPKLEERRKNIPKHERDEFEARFKKEEPANTDVIVAANCSAGGLTNSGTSFERDEHVLGFLSGVRWQSQQPASIHWFTEKELEVKAGEYGTRQSAAFWGMEWLQSELQKRVNSVDPDQILNDVLNGFVSGKYKQPKDSNSIAQFVIDYLKPQSNGN